MAKEIILTSYDPNFSVVAGLNGTDFVLNFAWNTRVNKWFIGISQADGTALVSGIAMSVDYPVFNRFASSDLPNGMLIPIDRNGKGIEARRYDLGNRVKLLFYDASELS